jgi:hypothetical protein
MVSGMTVSNEPILRFLIFAFCAFFAIFRDRFLAYLKSMACEAISKSDKKCIKNQMLRIGG